MCKKRIFDVQVVKSTPSTAPKKMGFMWPYSY
ncbi:unnamed protein product [Acanthoscelides obtectus]|uniref:Uncharacterized protein n=1 Tax=Acanthoscelides obtectus TaxID=200917 RepID=A0A9P0QEE6_ACAOB|nr:unnamed protein product [Acanthoscelides obtectus]CAK1688067.1 hypothetical protein AOBTE_LOCUS36539 [Acanthoscelides obtectus]